MAIISDKSLLLMERTRAKLVDTLRHQGVYVEDDAPMDVCVEKIKEIKQLNTLLEFELTGEIYGDENIQVLNPYTFHSQKITKADLPFALTVGSYCFSSNNYLKLVNIPKVELINGGLCNNCSELIIIAMGNAENVDSYYHFTNDNKVKVADIGLLDVTAWEVTPCKSSSLRHLILRRTTSSQTLTSSTYLSGLFNTTGGRLFVPKDTFDYSQLTNWSSKVFNQINLEGSRYEDINWLTNKNIINIIVDNEILDYIPDDEVVSVFKYTEGYDHLYDEDGIEIPENAIIGDYVGKYLTSEVIE